jgi:histidinol-phosphatase (PHP family)
MADESLEEYLNEIRKLRETNTHLELYAGLEVDYIPGITGPANFTARVDYTIGSVHFVESFADGTPWEIDGTYEIFIKGLGEIFQNDIRGAIERYYQLTREMILRSRPTVVGHLDKIKIQNQGTDLFSESTAWYRQAITQTLRCIKDNEVIVEVNTRGLYKNRSRTTYPSPWILNEIHKAGIPITLSSDAHQGDEMTERFGETAELLQAIGFESLTILEQGRWVQKFFNSNGITG